jgi:hypothetical protein
LILRYRVDTTQVALTMYIIKVRDETMDVF